MDNKLFSNVNKYSSIIFLRAEKKSKILPTLILPIYITKYLGFSPLFDTISRKVIYILIAKSLHISL